MVRRALVGVSLVAVAAAAVWFLLRGDEPAAGVDPVAPPAASAAPPAASLAATTEGSPVVADAPQPDEPGERTEVPFELPEPAAAGSGRVVGTVRWADDRQPVADVVVRLEAGYGLADHLRAPQTRTGADGSFAFPDAPVRRCTVTCALGGEKAIVVRAGAETRVDLLVPRGVAVEGVVLDDAGQGVGGAEVWMSSTRGSPDYGDVVARGDARGAFRVANIVGRRWIGARARGYVGSAVSLVEGAPGRLELLLARSDARVRGFVRDAQGQPCARAVVAASPPGAPGWRAGSDGTQQRLWAPVGGLADEQGAFLLEGLPPGKVSVRAHAPGHGRATTEVEVAAGAMADVVLTLPVPAMVHGRVAGADGVPVRAFLIFGEGDELGRVWTGSEADGTFRAEGVTPGEVRAAVFRDGKQALTATLQLAAGEDREWNPALGRAAGLRGRVVDGRGQPLAGYYVVAFLEGRGLGEVQTDAAGAFAFANMPNEALSLRVGFQPRGGDARARSTALIVPDVVPPRDDLVLVVPDDRLPSVRVRARVLRADGMPAAAAVLWVGADDERGVVQGRADAGGQIDLQDVVPGGYYLSIREGEHPTLYLGQRTFAARDDVDLGELHLQAGGRIVVTPRPVPAVDASALTIEVLDAQMRAVGNLQAAGASLRSPVLPAGNVTLTVSGRGIARARHEVTVEAGRELAIDLDIQPGLRRTVRIQLPVGAPTPRWVWATVFGDNGRDILGGGGAKRDEQGVWLLDLWLPARACSVMVGAEGQKLRGEVAVPASLPDGAVLDLLLQPR